MAVLERGGEVWAAVGCQRCVSAEPSHESAIASPGLFIPALPALIYKSFTAEPLTEALLNNGVHVKDASVQARGCEA